MTNPAWSKPGLILLGMWGMGGTIVIYLSGLQDVPVSSAGGGGTGWGKLVAEPVEHHHPDGLAHHAVQPDHRVILHVPIFAQAYVFRGFQGLGYPLNSTLFYSVYLYQNGFLWLKMGYASAMAWVLFIIILICTLLLLKVSDRFTYYAG